MKKKLEYFSFRILVVIFAIIPFPILYFLSDITYFFIFYILKYRKKVVLKNLKNSFPDKSEVEINLLCKKFFKHLSDITLESIKSMTISQKQLSKRYVIENTEILEDYFLKKQSILCLTSHYGNWEYGILATGNVFKHQVLALYLPLSNGYTENYGVKKRERFGTKMLSIRETKKIFSDDSEIPNAIILAADQNPSNKEKMIWVNFLNQDTACLHGPEAYAKKTNFPLIYFKITKIKRGFYSLKVEEFIKNPADVQNNLITERYMQKVEADIIQQPEYWLWLHKRWKHKRNI